MLYTPRRNIPYPNTSRGDRPDAPLHFKNIADLLDVDVLFDEGTNADRLTATHTVDGGRFWWTTDDNKLWYDDGTNWHLISADLSGTILASMINAKGDLIVGDSDDTPGRLPVGTDGQIIVADSGATHGISWNDRTWVTVVQAASFTSQDDPTYVMTVVGVDLRSQIGPKTRIEITQTTTKYFLVSAISFSGGNSVITMYGGNNYDLASAAITTVRYSNAGVPNGFPFDPTAWNWIVEYTANKTVSNPTANAWNDLSANITVPIGYWRLKYQGHLKSAYSSGQGQLSIFSTMSTTTSTETNHRMTASVHSGSTSNDMNKLGADVTREQDLVLAAKTTYNLLAKAADPNCTALGFYSAVAGYTLLEAECKLL